MPVINDINNLRTTVATKMNTKTVSGDGSSRSHAFFILRLSQLIDGEFQQTKFTLVDLAGAERPGKTG
jgi:hypothetical protein